MNLLDVAGLPLGLRQPIPQVMVVGPPFGMPLHSGGGLKIVPRLHHGVHIGHSEGMVAGADVQMTAQQARRRRGFILLDEDVRLSHHITDAVRVFIQQRRQGVVGLVVSVGLPIGDGEGVAVHIVVELGEAASQFPLQPRHQSRFVLGVMPHHPRPVDLIFHIILVFAGQVTGGPGPAFRHPRLRNRVRQQILRRAGVEAALRHQPLEHTGHVRRVEAGFIEGVLTHPVGLGLVGAAVTEAVLQRPPLGGGQRRYAMAWV